MTAIGKMLVFLVLFLSLVWNFLVVNAYTARTNWQREAKKYQAEAVAAADAANKMKALRDAEAESSDDAKRALQQERDRYYTQVAQLLNVRDALGQQYNLAFSQAQKDAATAAQLQAVIDKLSGQVTELDGALKARNDQLAKLVVDANNARADKERAEIEAKRQQAAAERNLETAQKLQEQLTETRLGTGGIPGVRTPTAPVGFRGTVTRVEKDRDGNVFVAISPGLDAGLKSNTILQVNRTAPAGRFVGKLKVTYVQAKEAVGSFEPAQRGAALTGDNLPKAGDQVSAYN
jgi:hypothetical protein